MPKYTLALGVSVVAVAIAAGGYFLNRAPSGLKCVEATSSGSFGCKDAGNFDSTCATATCPAGYTLTGGGGACAAGDRKVKSLFPRSANGEFTIACEQQGVAPQAQAICCKIE